VWPHDPAREAPAWVCDQTSQEDHQSYFVGVSASSATVEAARRDAVRAALRDMSAAACSKMEFRTMTKGATDAHIDAVFNSPTGAVVETGETVSVYQSYSPSLTLAARVTKETTHKVQREGRERFIAYVQISVSRESLNSAEAECGANSKDRFDASGSQKEQRSKWERQLREKTDDEIDREIQGLMDQHTELLKPRAP
jgi:hypothetical protein